MKSNWEVIARAQLERANLLQQRVEVLEHAMNLYANNNVKWSPEFPRGQERKEQFGFGVAFDCPITDEMIRAMSPEDTEDIYVVFWRTIEGRGQLLRAFELEEFRQLPQLMQPTSESERRMLEQVNSWLDRIVGRMKKPGTPRENP